MYRRAITLSEPSPESDDISVDIPNEVRIRGFAGHMEGVGNVDW